jgi:long-chain acyl-CoA synthetase
MLPTGVAWVCLDQAAQSLGLVVVPLYPTDNAENACYILADCGARLLVTEIQFACARGREACTGFVVLGFLEDADTHGYFPSGTSRTATGTSP